jgi:hypothetical protein
VTVDMQHATHLVPLYNPECDPLNLQSHMMFHGGGPTNCYSAPYPQCDLYPGQWVYNHRGDHGGGFEDEHEIRRIEGTRRRYKTAASHAAKRLGMGKKHKKKYDNDDGVGHGHKSKGKRGDKHKWGSDTDEHDEKHDHGHHKTNSDSDDSDGDKGSKSTEKGGVMDKIHSKLKKLGKKHFKSGGMNVHENPDLVFGGKYPRPPTRTTADMWPDLSGSPYTDKVHDVLLDEFAYRAPVFSAPEHRSPEQGGKFSLISKDMKDLLIRNNCSQELATKIETSDWSQILHGDSFKMSILTPSNFGELGDEKIAMMHLTTEQKEEIEKLMLKAKREVAKRKEQFDQKYPQLNKYASASHAEACAAPGPFNRLNQYPGLRFGEKYSRPISRGHAPPASVVANSTKPLVYPRIGPSENFLGNMINKFRNGSRTNPNKVAEGHGHPEKKPKSDTKSSEEDFPPPKKYELPEDLRQGIKKLNLDEDPEFKEEQDRIVLENYSEPVSKFYTKKKTQFKDKNNELDTQEAVFEKEKTKIRTDISNLKTDYQVESDKQLEKKITHLKNKQKRMDEEEYTHMDQEQTLEEEKVDSNQVTEEERIRKQITSIKEELAKKTREQTETTTKQIKKYMDQSDPGNTERSDEHVDPEDPGNDKEDRSKTGVKGSTEDDDDTGRASTSSSESETDVE